MLRRFSWHIRLLKSLHHSKNIVSTLSSHCSPSIAMDFSQAVKIVQSIAPTNLAEDWVNVGLLVEPTTPPPLTHVLLTIDLTEAVLEEALGVANRVGLIVSYHPPIFRPLKRLTQSTTKERIIVRAIESRVGIYSPHTSHDSLWGGVNDWLIAAAGKGVVSPLSTKQIIASNPLDVLVSGVGGDDVREVVSLCATDVNVTGEGAITCSANDRILSKMYEKSGLQ